MILKNNTASTLPVQLLLPGNPNDIANQATTYHVNLVGQTFSAQAFIQWRTRGSSGAYTTSRLVLLQLNIDGLVDALNLLNIGSFWKTSNTMIDAASGENEFGFITIGAPLFIINATASFMASIFIQGITTGTIDWGDGSAPDTYTGTGTYTHVYGPAGTYDINLMLVDPTTLIKMDANTNLFILIGDLSSYTNLSVLLVQNNQLTAIDISTNSQLVGLDIRNNNLPTSAINASLIALDGFGLFAGNYLSNGQTPPAPPSGAGAVAKTSLQGKGWVVTTD